MTAVVVTSDAVLLDAATAAPSNMPRPLAGEDFNTGGLVVGLGPDGRAFSSDCRAIGVVTTVLGITLHPAQEGCPVSVATSGDVTLSAGDVMVVGDVYFGGRGLTAGNLVPDADLGSGDLSQVVGIAVTTRKIRVRPWNTDIARTA